MYQKSAKFEEHLSSRDIVCALRQSQYSFLLYISLCSSTFEGNKGKVQPQTLFFPLTNNIPLKSENIQEKSSLIPVNQIIQYKIKIFS